MRYMLDTNICIHLMHGSPPGVVEKFAGLRVGDVVMSAVTHAELCYGVERQSGAREQAAAALRGLVDDIPVLPFDEAAGASYGVLRAAVRDRRRDALDSLIAAHAISRDLVLVTNNEADFRDYPGIRLENWVAGSP